MGLPILLRRAEICLGERLPIGCDGGERAEHDAGENAGGEENPMRDHLLANLRFGLVAYRRARKPAVNHYGLKHTQQAVLSNIAAAHFLRKRTEGGQPQYRLMLPFIAQLGANSGANF
jgi:hypothetical protein